MAEGRQGVESVPIVTYRQIDFSLPIQPYTQTKRDATKTDVAWWRLFSICLRLYRHPEARNRGEKNFFLISDLSDFPFILCICTRRPGDSIHERIFLFLWPKKERKKNVFVYPNVFLFFLHVLMWDRRAREKFKLRSSAVLQTAGSQKKRNTRRALFFCYFCERIPVASDVSLCVYIKKINKYFSNVCLLRGTVRKKEAKKKKTESFVVVYFRS